MYEKGISHIPSVATTRTVTLLCAGTSICSSFDGRNRSVEAIRLAFGGQPLAVVVVAEVLKCTFAAPKQEHSEHRVKIPTGGVIRVSPDPVGAAPPELP